MLLIHWFLLSTRLAHQTITAILNLHTYEIIQILSYFTLKELNVFVCFLPSRWLVGSLWPQLGNLKLWLDSLSSGHVKKTDRGLLTVRILNGRCSQAARASYHHTVSVLFSSPSLWGFTHLKLEKVLEDASEREEKAWTRTNQPLGRRLPLHWYWQYRFRLTLTGTLCNQMSRVCTSSCMWSWEAGRRAQTERS